MATPTEHASRAYAVYLRGPVATNLFGFATKDDYRAGVQHLGLMTVIPAPVDSPPNDFGILVGTGFTVEIADEGETGGIDGLGTDWYILQETGDHILLEDGTGALIEDY